VAESEGRFPRTRAAAALGVSLPAFDAGCRAAGYTADEWHHVGRYATRVDYYDAEALRAAPSFWEGCAAHYKSAAKRAAMLAAAAQARIDAAESEVRERQEVVRLFRERLIRQRDCSRTVRRHDSRHAWIMRCQRIGAAIEPFDVSAMLAATAAWRERSATAIEMSRRFDAIIAQHFRGGGSEYYGLGVKVLIHGGNTQGAGERRVVNIYGMKKSMNLKLADAVSLLQHRIMETLNQ
jgi:hypothetical protein